jgi:hypothetical protein
MSMRAVIYGRVSTDREKGNFSMPSQIAECLKYVKHAGYLLVGDQYIDPDSGYVTDLGNGSIPAYIDDHSSINLSRTSLDAALNYLETVGFDILVLHIQSWDACDPYIRHKLENEFAIRGAKVERILWNLSSLVPKCFDPYRGVDPTTPCYACGYMNYEKYPDGSGYFCATCHPLHSR